MCVHTCVYIFNLVIKYKHKYSFWEIINWFFYKKKKNETKSDRIYLYIFIFIFYKERYF